MERFGWRPAVGCGIGARSWVLAAALVLVGASTWTAPALGATSPAVSGSVSSATSLSGSDAVAVSGNYAYATGYYPGTLTVVDISNPASPRIVGQTPSASSLLNGTNIAISGSYAYVVSKNRNGTSGSGVNDDGTGNSLTIVNIGDPTTPTIVGSLHDAVNLFGAYGVAVSGMYAYVAAQGCLNGQPCKNTNVGDDFAVVDVLNPSNPTLVATIHNQALPAPWTGSGALKHATSVALAGDVAYITAAYSNRLTAIDVTNPTQPTIVGSIQDNTLLQFPVDVATANGYAFVADQAQGLGRISAVDIHDPTAMQIAGSLPNNTWLNGAYRIRVRNSFAYVAATYASTMAAVDISDPTQLRFAGGIKNTALLDRTTGLDIDPSGQYAVSISPSLSTETPTSYPPYPLQPGGGTATGTVTAMALDPTPVGVTITPSSEPPSTTLQTTANFSFTLADAVSTPRCSLDTSAFALCSTPTTQAYSALPPGLHTFTVEAIDAAGNTATASYSWTVTVPQPPANTSLSTISGQPVQRQLLFATQGTWTGTPAPTFAYQWQDCDSSGNNCTQIPGATSAEYTVTTADVGSTLVVVVTATSSAGVTPASSNPTAVVTAASALAPTTPVLDGFDRANGAAGSNWSLIKPSGFAVMNVKNDAAVDSSASAFTWDYWNPTAFGPDSEAYATITAWGASDVIRIGARIVSAGTSTYSGYFVAINGTGVWSILRIDNGAINPTTLVTGPTQPLANGDQIAIRIVGTTITALHYTLATNWTQVLTYNTNNDTTRYTNPGALAIEFKTSTIDNFGGGTLTTASSPPANQTQPSISGTPTVGQTLTLNPGTWTGNPTPTLTMQWQDCDSTGHNCVAITGATSTTYTLTNADAGSTINAVVTATNTAGTTTAPTPATAVVTAASSPPANQTQPSISGTPTVGQTLTLNPGTWTGNPTPTLTMQWQDCDSTGHNCVAITGATSTTYTLTNADAGSTINAVVTATNTAGTTTAPTPATAVVTAASSPPANQTQPSISGTPTVGQTLTLNPGTWTGNPTPTLTMQWQDCDSTGHNCVAITGATSTTYTLTNADAGSTINAVVTATNTAGTTTAPTPATAVVTAASSPPANQTQPSISGTPTVGQTLTLNPGTWTGNPTPTLTMQWQDCDSTGHNCVAITGATSTTYTLTNADAGSTINAVVTATNTAGTTTAPTPATAVVTAASSPPANQTQPSISGTPTVGQTLTLNPGTWTGNPTPTLTMQWQDCDSTGHNCVAITGATSTTYTLTNADAGSTINAVVTATNTAGTTTAPTPATAVVTAASSPPANQTQPSISGTPTVGQTLTLNPGTWTGNPTPTLTMQWQDCDSTGHNCVAITGATSTTYTLTNADAGSTINAVVTATNTAGTTTAPTPATAVVTASSSGLAPTTPILDSFDRANGAAGPNWSLIKPTGFAAMNITSNAAVDSSTSAFAWNYWNPTTYGPDTEAYATITTFGASDIIRIGARITGAGTTSYSGYFVAISATGVWSILRIDNAATTTLATGPTQPLANGDQIAIRIVGTTITALHYTLATNWTQVLTYNTNNDTTRYTNPGALAIEFKTSTIDNFGGGTLTTASSPPANQTQPSISGTPTVGQTLTLNPGTWTGNPTPTLTMQWQDCDSTGHNCVAITGATSTTYTLTNADAGSTINAVVTATNTAGTTTAPTPATAVVTASSSGLAPTTPILDSFDRANGAAGPNWSLIKPTGFAAMNITSNAAVDSSTSAFAWNYWNPTTYGPDTEAYATITTFGASDIIRIGARITGAGTTSYSGYFVAISATGVWSILRIDNAATTTLATGPTQPLANGDQIAIRIVGTTITALHYTLATNWTQVLTYNTNNDTTRYTNPGALAIEFKTSTIDNFGGGTL